MKFLFLFYLSFSCFAQVKDYNDYHRDINKAEELYFINNDVDSALKLYDDVFDKFDFIFLKDLLNAAQIAAFTNRSYKKYLDKGFLYGLKISHLNKYPLLNNYNNLLTKNDKTKQKRNRKKYLKKIDFNYLDIVYKLSIKDQKNKSLKDYFTKIIKEETDSLIKIIKKKGFPGDKIVGISDSLIFKEIGKPELDLHSQINGDEELFYMTSDEHLLSSIWPIVLFVHNPCSCKLYDEIFKDEISKGNLHPREYALIYDNVIRFYDELPKYCENAKIKKAFYLNIFTDYEGYKNRGDINALRAEFNIVSLEVDKVKKEYESKYGFDLFSGFWQSR